MSSASLEERTLSGKGTKTIAAPSANANENSELKSLFRAHTPPVCINVQSYLKRPLRVRVRPARGVGYYNRRNHNRLSMILEQ